MPTPLIDKSAISQVNPEQEFQELIYCWLSEWFGHTRSIGTDPALQNLVFPAAQLTSGPPISGDNQSQPVIHQSLSDRRLKQQCELTRHEYLFCTYYIQNPREGDPDLEADALNRKIANLLFLLHRNSPKQALVDKGILHAVPQRGPTYRASNTHHTRLLTIRYEIAYEYSAEI